MNNGDSNGNTYTEAEIQGVIWGLTNGESFIFVNQTNPTFGTIANAREIHQMALSADNAEGFVPRESDIVSIILDPTNAAIAVGNKQPIIGVGWDDLAQDCVCY